jgi:hypothetical protein
MVFHVYDRKHLKRILRRYTVEAGKTLDDSAWNAAGDGGVYDLDVYSTNGFVRTSKGNVTAQDRALRGWNSRWTTTCVAVPSPQPWPCTLTGGGMPPGGG